MLLFCGGRLRDPIPPDSVKVSTATSHNVEQDWINSGPLPLNPTIGIFTNNLSLLGALGFVFSSLRRVIGSSCSVSQGVGETDIELKRQSESGPLGALPSPIALYDKIKELNSPLIAHPSVSVNYANNDQLLSTLLHELTHVTQYKYGLGQGANSGESDFETYYASPGEQQSRMTQARALMSPQELANESPKTTMERLMRLHNNEK